MTQQHKVEDQQVVFQFGLDELVYTPFGSQGIIQLCGIDRSGVVYFVKTENHSDWYHEDLLIKVDA